MDQFDRLSRRHILAAAASLAAVPAFAQAPAAPGAASRRQPTPPSSPVATPQELAALPIIKKTVVKLYNTRPTIMEPNDLDFLPNGDLLILDQVDQPTNKVFVVDANSGQIKRSIVTEGLHSSGISMGNGAWWITSTKGDGKLPPQTIKLDPATGKTLKKWETPGWGFYGMVTTPSGAHGLKWVDGKYWMAVPAAGKIFLMEPETGQIVRSIRAPVARTHGIAWDQGALWCIGSDDQEIYKMDPKDGRLLGKIKLTKEDPVLHGLAIDKTGVLWYCDAGSGWVCKLV
jgi:streptogramin lyase